MSTLLKAWFITEVVACFLFFDYVVRKFADIENISYFKSIKRIFKGMKNIIRDRLRGING